MQMMQQAQSMMANMTPEQMASMQQMVQNMSPEQRANMERMAQQQMGGGMGGAPPGAPAAGTSQSPQAQYQLGGARMLKDEGNTLHKAGRHSEALAKYEKAISNVSGFSSSDAVELKTSCELNKAMCHLKLKQWKPCEVVCSDVLTRALLSPSLSNKLTWRKWVAPPKSIPSRNKKQFMRMVAEYPCCYGGLDLHLSIAK